MRDCDAERARLFRLLTSYLEDQILASREAILDYLNDLGVRDLGGRAIHWRKVYVWAHRHGFPLLPGVSGRRWRYAAVSSKLAVHAWLLSRAHNGMQGLFAVWPSTATKNVRARLQHWTAPLNSDPLAAQPDADSLVTPSQLPPLPQLPRSRAL